MLAPISSCVGCFDLLGELDLALRADAALRLGHHDVHRRESGHVIANRLQLTHTRPPRPEELRLESGHSPLDAASDGSNSGSGGSGSNSGSEPGASG